MREKPFKIQKIEASSFTKQLNEILRYLTVFHIDRVILRSLNIFLYLDRKYTRLVCLVDRRRHLKRHYKSELNTQIISSCIHIIIATMRGVEGDDSGFLILFLPLLSILPEADWNFVSIQVYFLLNISSWIIIA